MQAQDKTDVDIKLLSSFSFPVQTRHQSGRYCLYRVTVGMGGGCLCRYFGQNISQLKCSAGQRDVREIKTNILGKIRDKDKAVPASPLVKTTTSHLLGITNVRELPPLALPASEYFSRFFLMNILFCSQS